jgi:hypothetical protein
MTPFKSVKVIQLLLGTKINFMPSSIFVDCNDFFRTSSLSAHCYATNAKSFLYHEKSLGYLLISVTVRTKTGILNSDKVGMSNLECLKNLICKHLKNNSPIELALESFSNEARKQARHYTCSYYAFSIVVSFNNGTTYHTVFGPDIEVSAQGEELRLGNLPWKKSITQDVFIKTVEVPLSFHDMKNNADKVFDLVHPRITNVNQLPGWKHAESLFSYIGPGSVTFLRNMWRVGATKENAAVVPSVKHESNQGTSDSKEVVAPRPVASTPSVVPIPEVISQKPKSTRAERDAERARLRNYSKFPKRKLFDDLYGVPDDEDTCTVGGIGVVMWQDAKLGRIESNRDVVTRKMVRTVYLKDGRSFNLTLVSERWYINLRKLNDK